MSLKEELIELRKRLHAQGKEIRSLKEDNEFLAEARAFFAVRCWKLRRKQRLKFIAIKADEGNIKGKISFYCRALKVYRQAFYNYLKNKDTAWKYQALADAIIEIRTEDTCNDTYGRISMYQALQLKQPDDVHIPSEQTVYRVMKEIGLIVK